MQHEWINQTEATQEAWETSLAWRCDAASADTQQWRDLLRQDAQERYQVAHTPRQRVTRVEEMVALVNEHQGLRWQYPEPFGSRTPVTLVTELFCKDGFIVDCYAADAETAANLREQWSERS